MDSLTFIRRWKSEKGAELIEFALTFPVLLLVAMGIMDFGLLLQRYEVLTNAAREGARVAVLPANYDVTARVNQYLLAAGMGSGSAGTPAVSTSQEAIGGGMCMTVVSVTLTFTHTYTFVGGIASLFGQTFSSKTLHATAKMRKEAAAVACGP